MNYRVDTSFRKCLLASAATVVFVASLAGCGNTREPAPTNKKVLGQDTPKAAVVTPVQTTILRPYRSSEYDPTLSKVVIRDKREWDLPETAARSLGKIGAAAVPELTKDLNSRDPEVRQRAADVLARIGPAAKQAVPDLVAALEDEDAAVRKSAALALGQIGPAASDAVPALMRVMKESVAEAPPDGKTQR